MLRVAQGWVLNWDPPLSEPTQESGSSAKLDSSRPSPLPANYLIEFREKGMANWSLLASSRERSLLLKDLKPAGEYSFRIYALSANNPQIRGSPSPEFKYQIPDNRRKPGSTQALSAGVVSGVLFFIACIVIAVCAVSMCNKRRKKRAEKGRYTCFMIHFFYSVVLTTGTGSAVKKR